MSLALTLENMASPSLSLMLSLMGDNVDKLSSPSRGNLERSLELRAESQLRMQ